MFKKCEVHDYFFEEEYGCPYCYLQKEGKPPFETIDDLVNAVMAKIEEVGVPEWAIHAPIVMWSVGSGWIHGMEVLWWDGGSYQGGNYGKETYYTYQGYEIVSDPVPDARYLEIDEIIPTTSTYGLDLTESPSSCLLEPKEKPALREKAENLDLYFEEIRPYATPIWKEPPGSDQYTPFIHLMEGVVDPKQKIKTSSLRQQTEGSGSNEPVFFKGQPVFGAIHENYLGERVSGPTSHTEDLVVRLQDLGILERVEVPQRVVSWPIAYLVAPKGINKIVVFDPLGIAALRREDGVWMKFDLVTGEIRRDHTIKKLFKIVLGGPTHFQLWKDEWSNKWLAIEERLDGSRRANRPYDEGSWGCPWYLERVGTLTHRQLQRFLKEKGSANVRIQELL